MSCRYFVYIYIYIFFSFFKESFLPGRVSLTFIDLLVLFFPKRKERLKVH